MCEPKYKLTELVELIEDNSRSIKESKRLIKEINNKEKSHLAREIRTKGGFRKNLKNTNLDLANLKNANLGLANLSNANLKLANLSGAYLNGADLSGADLKAANLSNAYLRGAKINNTIFG